MGKLIDWLELFKYSRATYSRHWSVRLVWWLMFALGGVVAGVFGWILAVGGYAFIMLGQEYGVSHISTADVVGWYAARICLATGRCTSEHVLAVVLSVGIVGWGLGFLLWMLFPSRSLRPDPVTEEELSELRQLGYIVMETEDFEDAVNEHLLNWVGPAAGGGRGPKSRDLDQAGDPVRGTTAPGEVHRQPSGADQR